MHGIALLLAQPDEPVETSLTWPQLATGVAALMVIASALLGGLIWMVRAIVHRETKPARQAADRLTTTNGRSVGHLVESLARQLPEVHEIAEANRSRLEAMEHRQDKAELRLDLTEQWRDRHLAVEHGRSEG